MWKIVQEIQLTSGDLKRRYSYVRKIIKGHTSLAPPRCRIPSTPADFWSMESKGTSISTVFLPIRSMLAC